jgi:hypothetical protein
VADSLCDGATGRLLGWTLRTIWLALGLHLVSALDYLATGRVP